GGRAEGGRGHAPCPPTGRLADDRQAGADAPVVGDGAAPGFVQRDVEVGPQQNAAPGDLDVVDAVHVLSQLSGYPSRDATSAVRSMRRLGEPHSLSYQPVTFTWLPNGLVRRGADGQGGGEPTMSEGQSRAAREYRRPWG